MKSRRVFRHEKCQTFQDHKKKSILVHPLDPGCRGSPSSKSRKLFCFFDVVNRRKRKTFFSNLDPASPRSQKNLLNIATSVSHQLFSKPSFVFSKRLQQCSMEILKWILEEAERKIQRTYSDWFSDRSHSCYQSEKLIINEWMSCYRARWNQCERMNERTVKKRTVNKKLSEIESASWSLIYIPNFPVTQVFIPSNPKRTFSPPPPSSSFFSLSGFNFFQSLFCIPPHTQPAFSPTQR